MGLLSYDTKDVTRRMNTPTKKEGSRTLLTDGFYNAEILGAEAYVSPNSGNLNLQVTLGVLDSEGNTTGRPLRTWVQLPFNVPEGFHVGEGVTPNADGLTPEQMGRAEQSLIRFLVATGAQLPEPITWDATTKTFTDRGTGETYAPDVGSKICKERKIARRTEAAKIIESVINDAATDEERKTNRGYSVHEFDGINLVARVVTTEDGQYNNVKGMYSTVPDGRELAEV